jgi:hypothetical protein
MGALRAHSATSAWVGSFVCGLGLCPWAVPSQTLVAVAPHAAPPDAHVRFMLRQADLLLAGARPHARANKPTVVCAFTSEGYADVAAFARLWQAVETSVEARAPGDLVLLAFHPQRVDHGPGCLPDIESDAGHFSVRSPWPTLQLLRAIDVDDARREWSHKHGGRGAFGLLVANKRKLRAIGSAPLRERLDVCRVAGPEGLERHCERPV